jgi:tetratricopeptide (TPR) repeat protein
LYCTVQAAPDRLRQGDSGPPKLHATAEGGRHLDGGADGRFRDGAGLQPRPAEDADALYTKRDDVSSATRAADIWAARLARDARDFEAAWKLARAGYWLGGHLPRPDERRAALERGIAAANKAVAAQPKRPEGHFWLAATMGGLAESAGLRAGIKYRKPVREALERVLGIDPAFQQGSADRALGRWYFKVPRLFGGSKDKSERHLRKSLTYNPNSISSLYFLAETLLEMDREQDAIKELQKAIDAPVDPEWAPEDREFKQKTAALLKELRGR